jgi:predicted transcriptional regulator
MPGMILFKEKQAKILLSLKNAQQPWHIAGLATACGGTYVHTHNFIKGCAALGIVSVEKHGKSKEIKLTEKGTQLVDILSVVYSMINPSPQVPVKSEEKKEEKKDEKKEEKKEEKK